jgi:hypothetical protein
MPYSGLALGAAPCESGNFFLRHNVLEVTDQDAR